MRFAFPAIAFCLAAPTVAAAEASGEASGAAPLKLRPKAAMSVASAPARVSAPFVEPPAAEPEVDLFARADARAAESRSSCSSQRALCYDPQSGRIVYKPARALMPDIPGMQRENISVKRDRITLRYSF